mmetsp:Transcript_34370/g.40451  ORF Transcript_34370/g.40451 Transcript_34370/m.40451 type:complete len:143 (+) Transcript_34370:3-431(+)
MLQKNQKSNMIRIDQKLAFIWKDHDCLRGNVFKEQTIPSIHSQNKKTPASLEANILIEDVFSLENDDDDKRTSKGDTKQRPSFNKMIMNKTIELSNFFTTTTQIDDKETEEGSRSANPLFQNDRPVSTYASFQERGSGSIGI